MLRLHGRSIAIAALLTMTAHVASAAARDGAQTRLQRCGTDTCLLVQGRRADPRAVVRIAEHPVAVRGSHAWRAMLPLDDVRAWSTPFARTITVRVDEPGGSVSEGLARLPIGLLGHVTELASLEITAP